MAMTAQPSPPPAPPLPARRYLVVCRGPHCRERGSRPLRERLAWLLRGGKGPRLVGYNCFGQCERGPNVAFYPEGTWYGGLARPDDADRLLRHATGADELAATPLALPADERERHLRNIGDLVQALSPDAARPAARPRRRWWPFGMKNEE